MTSELSYDPGGVSNGLMEGSIAIAIACILVLVYYIFTHSARIRKWLYRHHGEIRGQIMGVLLSRLTGAFLFGGIPVVYLLFKGEGLPWAAGGDGIVSRALLLWLPTAIMIIALSFFISSGKSHLEQNPQIRAGNWDTGLLAVSALGWVVYLMGYEMLFRGFLLFACYNSFGYWPAILINILIYALAHIPKGRVELLGSMPVGFIFGIVTLWQGYFWYALLTHITMALSTEWFSLHYSPEMKFLSSKGIVKE